MSKWQRSASNSAFHLRHLQSKPIWTKSQTGHKNQLEKLERNWEIIRQEALNALKVGSN